MLDIKGFEGEKRWYITSKSLGVPGNHTTLFEAFHNFTSDSKVCHHEGIFCQHCGRYLPVVLLQSDADCREG